MSPPRPQPGHPQSQPRKNRNVGLFRDPSPRVFPSTLTVGSIWLSPHSESLPHKQLFYLYFTADALGTSDRGKPAQIILQSRDNTDIKGNFVNDRSLSGFMVTWVLPLWG